ncbi:IS200/IS605 family transposase [Halalkalibacter lacteus]|uniref:IS200/IS605 family transposase n=1 Tax=Halalkalibacter lacteus TaxID=3090663 RepID=UPI002FC9777F
MRERNPYFDNAKAVLIFLVVLGHILSEFLHEDQLVSSVYLFIYLFHMPAFVLIAGYFAKGVHKQGYIYNVANIHLLLSCPPSLAPSKIMQYLKGRSSRLLQDQFPELKKKYWGQHLWARGYFCATVGTVDEETIRNYIANQFNEEKNDIFTIEE